MSATSLTLKDFHGEVTIAPEFFAERDAAIAAAKAIVDVRTPEDLALAVEALRRLASLRKGIEDGRKFAKAPVIEKGREIDRLASEAIDSAERAEKDLLGKTNHYQRKQLEEQESRRREAEAQARKAKQERLAAEQEAERLRIAQEAAQKAAEEAARLTEAAKTTKAILAAKNATLEAITKAAELESQRLDAELKAETAAMHSTAIVPAVEQPKGVSARKSYDYEVVHAGNPFLERQSLLRFAAWAMQHNLDVVDISIRRRDLLELLNSESAVPEIPGLKIVETVKTRIR